MIRNNIEVSFGMSGYAAGYSTAAVLYIGNEYITEPYTTPLNQLTGAVIDWLKDQWPDNESDKNLAYILSL